jgi:hypothetical protein
VFVSSYIPKEKSGAPRLMGGVLCGY